MDLTPPVNPKTSLVIQKKTPQNKIAEAVLLVVIAALFYWFVVAPKRAALDTLTAQAQTLQGQQSQLADTKAKLQQAIADLNSHSKEVAEMDEALPLNNRVTEIYIALQDLTQNSGMAVGNISVSYSSSGDMAGDKALLAAPFSVTRTLQTYTTTLTASGSFDQFEALLNKLENSGRLINIIGLGVTTGQAGSLNFTLNLEAYYYAQ